MRVVRRVVAHVRRLGGTGPDHVIPPEIKHDEFYRTIIRIASTPGLAHILEIGSSSGAGSTEAFVKGILQNPDRPILHCMEVSAARFQALSGRYAKHPFVHCYRASSVPLESFPSPGEVEAFHSSVDSNFSAHPLEVVLGWRTQDMEYVAGQNVPTDGIRMIREEHGIETFDAVLIDGSEFTGMAELREVYGARFLLLDDIRTFKNHSNFHALSSDPAYRLIETSDKTRNGYAVFERVA